MLFIIDFMVRHVTFKENELTSNIYIISKSWIKIINFSSYKVFNCDWYLKLAA